MSNPLQENINITTKGVKCTCGGYCDQVDPTNEEIEAFGKDKMGQECCNRSFQCVLCGKRYSGKIPLPELWERWD